MTRSGRMHLYCNRHARKPAALPPDTTFASEAMVRTVKRFHRTLPAYRPTPLVYLEQLAHTLGVGGIWIKDESQRFALKAFKALGASYAVCATLAKRLAIEPPLDFNAFKQPGLRRDLASLTLVAASDGNHGAAVAWMADQLGCRSRIFLPRGTAACRVAAIENSGGRAIVVPGNYDEAVRQAAREEEAPDTLLIQDTAWAGYETIPRQVMQGYLTLFDEAFRQMGDAVPTHLFVPCGVGALAASLQAYLVERFAAHRPVLIVIEAAVADCYYRSMAAGGDTVIPVKGSLTTLMAGLACGEPTRPGWDLLRYYADVFASCHDAIAVEGMRRLAFPLTPDPPVEAGECGAVTLGCLCQLMQPEADPAWRRRIGLGPASKILLFSTEGATDPESYRQGLRHISDTVPAGD